MMMKYCREGGEKFVKKKGLFLGVGEVSWGKMTSWAKISKLAFLLGGGGGLLGNKPREVGEVEEKQPCSLEKKRGIRREFDQSRNSVNRGKEG